MSQSWPERFAKAGLAERVGLLAGGGVRLLAGAIDRGLEKAAETAVEAKRAFDREVDPNMTDARVIEEWEEPRDGPRP
ncbi:hypothetical protein [Rubrivirga sp. IMCC45206]|uniref:hypothetical protein n=1 Tax=Rubrivirga sp. IMCC45206 TaxID=3391614 RepID=UPI00398FBFD5